MKMQWANNLAVSASSFVFPVMLNAYMKTLRFVKIRHEYWRELHDQGPFIYACFHGSLILPVWYHRKDKATALVSKSTDGEIIARIVKQWGFDLVRGSSSRDASEGLRGVIHALKQNSVAITVDGPRGPDGDPKMGAVAAARIAGVPILPVVGSAWPRRKMHSWDNFMLPSFFSRAVLVYGKPLEIPRSAKGDELEEYRLELKRRMLSLREEAEDYLHETRK